MATLVAHYCPVESCGVAWCFPIQSFQSKGILWDVIFFQCKNLSVLFFSFLTQKCSKILISQPLHGNIHANQFNRPQWLPVFHIHTIFWIFLWNCACFCLICNEAETQLCSFKRWNKVKMHFIRAWQDGREISHFKISVALSCFFVKVACLKRCDESWRRDKS